MDVLFTPSRELLSAYLQALEQGWEPAITGPKRRGSHLEQAAQDPDAFLRGLTDLEGVGHVEQFDGTLRPRLPSRTFWIMDGDAFAGTLSLRWQPGSVELPNWVHGHVGWHVVPAHRGKGLAPQALQACLPTARALGLPHLDLAILTNNTASIRAAEKCGAVATGPTLPTPLIRSLHGWGGGGCQYDDP